MRSRIKRFKDAQATAKDELDLIIAGMMNTANTDLEFIKLVEEVKKEILRLTFKKGFLYQENPIPNTEFTKILIQYKKSIILCYKQNSSMENRVYNKELVRILESYKDRIIQIFG